MWWVSSVGTASGTATVRKSAPALASTTSSRLAARRWRPVQDSSRSRSAGSWARGSAGSAPAVSSVAVSALRIRIDVEVVELVLATRAMGRDQGEPHQLPARSVLGLEVDPVGQPPVRTGAVRVAPVASLAPVRRAGIGYEHRDASTTLDIS